MGQSICTHALRGARAVRDIYLQMDVSRGFHLVPKMVRGGVEICKMLTNSKQGFDCKFMEPPLAAPQTDCPVCLLVLREPYQVTCCGKSYYKSCIVCYKGRQAVPMLSPRYQQPFPEQGAPTATVWLQSSRHARRECL